MEPFVLLALLVFALLAAGVGVLFAVTARAERTIRAPELAGKRPQGYWMGVGIAGGILLGYVFALLGGVLLNDLKTFVAFGPSTGMLFGLAIGYALEERHKNEVRPPTAAEQQARWWALIAGIVVLVLGVFATVAILLFA
jgi:hypothetical protein